MKRTLIRYKTKPDMADSNAELIARVFEELKAAKPEACAIFRCGSTTIRSCTSSRPTPISASALPGLAAFKAFQSGIRERCIEPPQPGSVTIVGNYRMLAEPGT